MNMLIKSISPLLFILFTLNVVADTHDTPFNYKIDLLKSRAKRGNQIDQFILGQAYMTGNKLLKKDVKQGVYWLTQSADKGHAEAQEYLGEVYHFAEGVPHDYRKAFHWFDKAAKNGRKASQDYIAQYYFGGLGGINKDIDKALYWFQVAIDNGSTVSEANMAWVLATCTDARYRNGTKAVLMAMELIARKGFREANDLDNLAAAYAETGDFKKAVLYQKQAVEMLDKDKENARYDRYSKRLNLYTSGQKYRE